MNEIALAWLNKQLRKKNIALHIATNKKNPSDEEISNIQSAIGVLEYLIQIITTNNFNSEVNGMKEATVTTVLEITSHGLVDDERDVISKEDLIDRIKMVLDVDHVIIKDRKIFIRDLPNQS